MSTEASKPRPIVPIEYAGLWIAWNHDSTRIVASGCTVEEALRAAVAVGEKEPFLEKIPKSNVHSVGGLRP
jgi:hypothetical protein